MFAFISLSVGARNYTLGLVLDIFFSDNNIYHVNTYHILYRDSKISNFYQSELLLGGVGIIRGLVGGGGVSCRIAEARGSMIVKCNRHMKRIIYLSYSPSILYIW